MDPVLIAFLAKYGIDAVIGIIGAWRESGEPTPEEIRQAFIVKKPEDYFKTDEGAE
jgi:hypothetical protein